MIKQRYPGDCSVASLAMFLGLTYEAAVTLFKRQLRAEFRHGVSGKAIFDAAYRVGTLLGCIEDRAELLSAKALLVVPSINIPDGTRHMVYWDGRNVHDPSSLLTYDDSLLAESIIFYGYHEIV